MQTHDPRARSLYNEMLQSARNSVKEAEEAYAGEKDFDTGVKRWAFLQSAKEIAKRITISGIESALIEAGLEVASADPEKFRARVVMQNRSMGRPTTSDRPLADYLNDKPPEVVKKPGIMLTPERLRELGLQPSD